ncbi:Gfo/Idh/MocA family oxidoreductase [Jannaschia pohangensis]|uniref:Gfo/Idh/MocA family oxidoreductase n=1 Tax=Jannaschia pohangensis TaxID=390807 RepID=UPI001FE03A1E|nr:Gfo/Idh/MocA family oxidoreductase [Jannaschia pohangensis]
MRVGLIGTGMVAETHVAAIRGAGLTLSVVMGRDPERTQAFAARHGARAADNINFVA